MELRGIVLPVQVGGLLGGGGGGGGGGEGGKEYVGPPSQIIGGAWPPSSYAYVAESIVAFTNVAG